MDFVALRSVPATPRFPILMVFISFFGFIFARARQDYSHHSYPVGYTVDFRHQERCCPLRFGCNDQRPVEAQDRPWFLKQNMVYCMGLNNKLQVLSLHIPKIPIVSYTSDRS